MPAGFEVPDRKKSARAPGAKFLPLIFTTRLVVPCAPVLGSAVVTVRFCAAADPARIQHASTQLTTRSSTARGVTVSPEDRTSGDRSSTLCLLRGENDLERKVVVPDCFPVGRVLPLLGRKLMAQVHHVAGADR